MSDEIEVKKIEVTLMIRNDKKTQSIGGKIECNQGISERNVIDAIYMLVESISKKTGSTFQEILEKVSYLNFLRKNTNEVCFVGGENKNKEISELIKAINDAIEDGDVELSVSLEKRLNEILKLDNNEGKKQNSSNEQYINNNKN